MSPHYTAFIMLYATKGDTRVAVKYLLTGAEVPTSAVHATSVSYSKTKIMYPVSLQSAV
jgi:hypothetical protein